MKKQIGKNLMQKWKNKIRVRLSALDKKKLVLTNIPYILTAFYTNRASFLYRNSLGEDIGNKLLYAMEHADRILTGLQPSFNWRDMLTGIVAAVILKSIEITMNNIKTSFPIVLRTGNTSQMRSFSN